LKTVTTAIRTKQEYLGILMSLSGDEPYFSTQDGLTEITKCVSNLGGTM